MRLNRGTRWIVATAGMAALVTWSVRAQSMTPPGPALTQPTEIVKRGEYLVKSMGCWDCHTPHKLGEDGPEPDMSMWLAGHPANQMLPAAPEPKGPWIGSISGSFTAWAGPWGVSYTRNLTPDRETGLGEWTEQQFIDTMRTGRRQGRGRQLLPPMPVAAISNLSDEDLKAIFTYLRAIPAVNNRVPEPIVPAGTPQ
jgi:hypothetical protein